MAEFQTLNLCYSKNRVDVAQGLSYEVCSTNIDTLRLLILIFVICAIIQRQLVAMLRGFMKFVYEKQALNENIAIIFTCTKLRR